MLRHSAGYALAGRGVDTRTLQAFMGHRSISNTVIYTAVADKRLRNIWQKRQAASRQPRTRPLSRNNAAIPWRAIPGSRHRKAIYATPIKTVAAHFSAFPHGLGWVERFLLFCQMG
jgi:integrase-like protein